MKFEISKHCLEQIRRRGINLDEILEVLHNPGTVLQQDEDVSVYQSLSNDQQYVFRIFVNIKKQPNLVITAYKTSKISKYYENKI